MILFLAPQNSDYEGCSTCPGGFWTSSQELSVQGLEVLSVLLLPSNFLIIQNQNQNGCVLTRLVHYVSSQRKSVYVLPHKVHAKPCVTAYHSSLSTQMNSPVTLIN